MLGGAEGIEVGTVRGEMIAALSCLVHKSRGPQTLVAEDPKFVCSCVSTRTPMPVADARAKQQALASDDAPPPQSQDTPPSQLRKNWQF